MAGSEGKAYPMMNSGGRIAIYAKFFNSLTDKRLRRIHWLIKQDIRSWAPSLAAAPFAWADSKSHGRPVGIDFDINCSLSEAVAGVTWLETKRKIVQNNLILTVHVRHKICEQFVSAITELERRNFVHGDLSPNNILIDIKETKPGHLLYVIDFDAFVAQSAGPDRALTFAENGTIGSLGYCPPDLEKLATSSPSSAAPFSDKHARDMLLIELLLFDLSLVSKTDTNAHDHPPKELSKEKLTRRFDALMSKSSNELRAAFEHLNPRTVFDLAETSRPSSQEILTRLKGGAPVSLKRPSRVSKKQLVLISTVGVTAILFSAVRFTFHIQYDTSSDLKPLVSAPALMFAKVPVTTRSIKHWTVLDWVRNTGWNAGSQLKNLTDENPDTGWWYTTKGQQQPTEHKFETERTFEGLLLLNGIGGNERSFVTGIELAFEDGSSQTVQVANHFDWQVIFIRPVKTRNVKVRALDGAQSRDSGLSELWFLEGLPGQPAEDQWSGIWIGQDSQLILTRGQGAWELGALTMHNLRRVIVARQWSEDGNVILSGTMAAGTTFSPGSNSDVVTIRRVGDSLCVTLSGKDQMCFQK